MSENRRSPAIDAALVATILVWSVNFTVVKSALRHFSPMAFTAIRLSAASLCFFLLARLAPGPRILRQDWMRLVVLGLVGHTLYQVFFIQGIHATTASNSAILLGLTPVFVALLSVRLTSDRPSARAWLGIVISVIGVYLVLRDSARVGGSLLGDGLTLLATLCWSLHTVLSQMVVRRYGPLRTSAFAITIGTIGFLPLSLPELARMTPEAIPTSAWFGLAYSVVLSLVAAYATWYYAVARIGPTETAIYSNLTPVAAVAVAYLALGEPVGRLQLVGTAVILLGIYLVRRESVLRLLDREVASR